MDAYLYFNKSDRRYRDKVIEAVTYDGSDHIDVELKEDTSIEDPTFILRTQTKVLTANYFYVPDLNRYYYIEDQTLSHQRIYAECHVDVMMSFKKEYNQQNVIVARNEKLYNMYLDDHKYKVQNRTAVRTVVFPSGFTGHNIVLGVVGKNSE